MEEKNTHSYIVYARKWRPGNFDEVVGQKHITTTLKNAISNRTLAHAYIFTGPRGIGKTSVARILAKGLNCQRGPTSSPCNQCVSCTSISRGLSMDVIEIDGASNNSVDEIRELRENIKFRPSYGRYKIYIIDEVHMLSIGAFNALLKTLEEPPPHAKFIFATTNPEKVPQTVLSRCQRFDFRRIPTGLIVDKLRRIAAAEKINLSDEAAFAIGRAADGSMRDAESITDQLAAFCKGNIKQEDVTSLLGIVEEEWLGRALKDLAEKDTKAILQMIQRILADGKDIRCFVTAFLGYIRNLMVVKVSAGDTGLVDLPESHLSKLKEQSGYFNLEELLYIFFTLLSAVNAMKRSEIPRFICEAAFIKLALAREILSLADITEKISRLESGSLEGPAAQAGHGTAGSQKEDAPSPRDSRGFYGADSAGPEDKARTQFGESVPSQDARGKEGAAAHGLALKEEMPGEAATQDSDTEDKRGPLYKEEVSAKLPVILQEIKKRKISIAVYLSEGTLDCVRGNVIKVAFKRHFNFHREVLEFASNRKFIEEIASSIIGRDVRFEFVCDESNPSFEETREPADEIPGGREAETRGADVSDDPIVRSAMEIFEGRIIKGRGYE